jgi:putative transposase
MSRTIRSSTHKLKPTNTNKLLVLEKFMSDCNDFLTKVIDDIWENGYNDGNYIFNMKNNQYNIPSLLKDQFKHIDSPLTARIRKCLLTQVSGIIRAATEKQRKRIYVLHAKKEEGVSKSKLKPLIKAIKQNIPQKPNTKNVKFEIDGICNDIFETKNGKFYGFLRLKSIYKDKTEIYLPIENHRHLNKMVSKGKRLNSVLVSKNSIGLRWEFDIEEKTNGKKLGCDQGIKTLLTSTDTDGLTQVLPSTCPHGHNIEKIMDKLTRKKKGSNAFKKAVAHRKNHINYMINQLNLDDISEVKFEEIININKGKRVSRKMKHWTNTDIRDAVKSKCEVLGVRFTLVSCTYRSQRCSCCGLVRKSNRKGKIYTCKSCGYIDDADVNASKNQLVDLPEIPYNLRKARNNLGNGFIWLESGFYDVSGGHLQFPLPDKK